MPLCPQIADVSRVLPSNGRERETAKVRRRSQPRRRGLLAGVVLLGFGGAGHGEPAKPVSATTYTGECHRFDVVKSVARGECRTTVDSLTFVDGFTSIQFHAVDQNDKDTEIVAFIGPRWTQVDETHTSMVIEQVLATAPNPKSLNPITASGFCLFTTKTSEDPYDKPIKIYCEYNARNSSRIFILDNISDISRHDVR
jgi:hypothetical protein